MLRYLGRLEEGVDFPLQLYRYPFSPRRIRTCDDITEWFGHVPGIDAISVTWIHGDAMKLFVHRLWSMVLARSVLNDSEQAHYRESKRPPVALANWLLGRVAAKEAVRARLAGDLCLADIGIERGPEGRPGAVVSGQAIPVISFSHAAFAAVGAAADADVVRGIGIDVEPARPVGPEVIEDGFHPAETELIRSAGDEAWFLRAWTAKEAAGKACGVGMPGGPRNLRVRAIDPATGHIEIEFHGAAKRAVEALFEGEPVLTAYSIIRDGHIMSLCPLR